MMSLVMVTASKHGYLHTPTDTPHLLQLQLHHAVPCLLFAGCGDGIRQQTHTHTYTLLQKHPTCCSCSCTMQCCACSSLAVVMASTHKHAHLHTPTDTPHLLQLQLPMQCRACSSLAVVMATTHKNAYLHTPTDTPHLQIPSTCRHTPPTDTPHLLQLQLHHAVLCLLFAGSGDGHCILALKNLNLDHLRTGIGAQICHDLKIAWTDEDCMNRLHEDCMKIA